MSLPLACQAVGRPEILVSRFLLELHHPHALIHRQHRFDTIHHQHLAPPQTLVATTFHYLC